MDIFDILLLAVALSMDAAAVGMTDGMSNPGMPVKRTLLIGAFFGVFQALMPLGGYFLTKLVADSFLDGFEKASSCVSFLLLTLLGGKMIFDCVREMRAKSRGCCPAGETLSAELPVGKLTLQAIATSIDAFAIGVTFQLAEHSAEGLFPPVGWAVFIIGVVTFGLSVGAVRIGRIIGDKLADKAELAGGAVLVLIGIKLLVEGLL